MPDAEEMRIMSHDGTPRGLRIAASWAWRLILVGILSAGVIWLIRYFSQVTIPVAVAVLLTALLSPLNRLLRDRGVPRVFCVIVCLLVLLLVVGGVMTLLGAQIAVEAPSLFDSALIGLGQLLDWAAQGPLNLDQSILDDWISQLTVWIQSAAGQIASVAASAGAGIGHFIAGLAIAVLATFFFLLEGERISRFVLSAVPRTARPQATKGVRDGWTSLVAYMRAQVVVCLVDALGVLVAALVLNVPLPWALFGLTFVASFIPIVGAVLAGTIAVLLALMAHGWITALIMLGAVVLVMQMESHFLQPLLLGKAVDIHPLGVLLGIAAGSVVAGLVGALMAIPVLAFGVAFIRSLLKSAGVATDSGSAPLTSGQSTPNQP